MPMCCVYKCSQKEGHRFPKDFKLRKLWVHAVRRKNWTPTNYSIVCRSHFIDSDYIIESREGGYTLIRKRLKPNAVPTIFPSFEECFADHDKKTDIRAARKKRIEQRSAKRQAGNATTNAVTEGGIDEDIGIFDIAEEVISTYIQIDDLAVDNDVVAGIDMSSQTVAEVPRFSIDSFIDIAKAVHLYTGLENYRKFSLVLQTLGPAAYQLSQVLHLSIENQFFLTLIKLRLNKQIYELSIMFEISESTVSNIFNTWIPFMALQWREIDLWPSQELVKFYMPLDFQRKFPQTRVIVDGTEFPIGKPEEPNAQQVTFSTYKNRNTLKVLVGVSPGGLISYCSDAYGGSASDRQIVERSTLLNMCAPGDNIMADRGFNVQDLFAPKDIHINIPSFLKGKSQLSGLTVVHDRKIAIVLVVSEPLTAEGTNQLVCSS